ncbi:Uma2 family endonuclease [Synechococcus sp. H60.3]|uniref:Uma2 family endonuclease n=1 Tax=Synechococcus sp. H60.3 TaxID=2967124 RepID=UPI0039C25AB5
MVQVPVQPLTAEEYLRLTDWPYEGRLELEDGYIREVPTEERINTPVELFLIAEFRLHMPPPLLVNEKRDYQDKRKDYATGGIPEYWIGDPAKQFVSVFAGLVGNTKTRLKPALNALLPRFCPS